MESSSRLAWLSVSICPRLKVVESCAAKPDGRGGVVLHKLLVIMSLALSCAGCASATRGWSEQITITSNPSGAEAEVKGNETGAVCTTPCVVQVKRYEDISVTIKKEGYEPQVVPLSKEIPGTGAAGFAGNLLLGGVVGMVVDGVSGAAYDHKPNPVIVTLQPIAPPPAPPPPVRRRAPKPPTS